MKKEELTQERSTALCQYLLETADDHLILGHRLSEWCGHGPMLEEDIALTNIALDCIGAAQLLLTLCADLEQNEKTPDELAYFRDESEFKNCLLVEQPNGDFAQTILRQFFYDSYAELLFSGLVHSVFNPVSAMAEKILKETKYHLRHSQTWVLRLGSGTEESNSRMLSALEYLSPFCSELFRPSGSAAILHQDGIIPSVEDSKGIWLNLVNETLKNAELSALSIECATKCQGRKGTHSEHLKTLLAEMQALARAHPGVTW